MIDVVKLLGLIKSQKKTYTYLASQLNINPVTLSRRIDKGILNNTQIEILSKELGIDDDTRNEIFF